MQVDIPRLRTWFAMFNARYFDGKLPTPRFHVGRARTKLGTMSYKRKRTSRRTLYYDFTISLSNYYDQSEHDFQSVLLHEMIHLAIAHSGVKDTSPHGVVFRGMMERLNRDGWNIRITTGSESLEKAHAGSPSVIRQYLVLALELADGRRFLSSVNPRYAATLQQKLPGLKELKHFSWHTTDDLWFENMPRVRSFRGRLVSREVYDEKIQSMKPFDFPPLPHTTE